MDRIAMNDTRGKEPFWKSLFAEGEFGWVFRMRLGDAEAFFAPRDDGGALLAEKRRWLEERPELCAAVTPEGGELVERLWERAVEWGHVPPPGQGERDLPHLARHWEPDILVLDRETMSFAAACVCFPSSWSPEHAVGNSLHEVHEMVPRLNAQIGEKIDSFLRQLQSGKAYCRENWGFTRSAERNYHPALRRPPLDGSVTIDELHLRVEQQLFTAIPGGVLMGIRIETCPLADLAMDPGIWHSVAEKIRTMPEDVATYKGLRSAREAMRREMRTIASIGG